MLAKRLRLSDLMDAVPPMNNSWQLIISWQISGIVAWTGWRSQLSVTDLILPRSWDTRTEGQRGGITVAQIGLIHMKWVRWGLSTAPKYCMVQHDPESAPQRHKGCMLQTVHKDLSSKDLTRVIVRWNSYTGLPLPPCQISSSGQQQAAKSRAKIRGKISKPEPGLPVLTSTASCSSCTSPFYDSH